MSIETTPITIVLANRPRLFRELLQHALNTASPRFRVVEAADALPSPALLREVDWLIVDEEAANEAAKLAVTYPKLGILALEGRGIRARLLAPAAEVAYASKFETPTLDQLFGLLSHELVPAANSAS